MASALDPGVGCADDDDVIFARQKPRPVDRGLGALLAFALLLLTHACVLHGPACASPSNPPGAGHCAAASDHGAGCDDHRGCEHGTRGDCARASICCSAWAPTPASPGVPAPTAFLL